eukprot:scaffold1417_cov113-Cylindrotheca_fusiformis.AAC.3
MVSVLEGCSKGCGIAAALLNALPPYQIQTSMWKSVRRTLADIFAIQAKNKDCSVQRLLFCNDGYRIRNPFRSEAIKK